jgi:hypothetical protein
MAAFYDPNRPGRRNGKRLDHGFPVEDIITDRIVKGGIVRGA